jgi:signal transduction histidine kinase
LSAESGSGDRPALDERLLAEQEERRRLAELIHDGPVQHLAAVAQMLDAGRAALVDGDPGRARGVVERALALVREASVDLRELVSGLEPDALAREGFAAAVRQLASRVAERRGIAVDADVGAGDGLGEAARVGLYQIVRESFDQAVRRGPPSRIAVSVTRTPTGGAELVVWDDGSGERRRAVLDGLAERATTLNAVFALEDRDGGGTILRVTVPPSAAGR